MLSRACEYAIRAMIFIVSRTSDGSRVGIRDISKHTDVSEAFVAKILQSLVKKKMINSIKGPNGGFYVGAGQRLIPLIEVVKAIDGNDLFTTCGLGIKNCSEKRPCPIHNEFSAIRNDIMKMLKANTIQGLAARLTEGESFLLKR